MRAGLTHQAKLARLVALSEDDFRDTVIRPLFKLQKFRSYRDLCGHDEEGKDCVVLKDVEFGGVHVYAIQTKKGRLNMSSKVTENVATAITQLRTALNTQIPLLNPPRNVLPNVVYLCSSGATNPAARKHIIDALDDSRLAILDGDEIISSLDQLYPTYWLNISHTKCCYLEAFRNHLLKLSDIVPLASSVEPTIPPFVEDAYVSQQLFRFSIQTKVKQGHITTGPNLEEFEDCKLLTSQHRVGFIVGDGGTGKTTLMRRLALLTCESSLNASYKESCLIPVLFRARDLLHSDDLIESIHGAIRGFTGDNESGLEPDDFASGRVVVLIDGMDELVDHFAIEDMLQKISSFSEANPTCRVYSSSRALQLVQEFAAQHRLPIYEISDFSLRQAARIVQRAISGQPVVEAAAVEVLRRLQDVHGMKLSPMLVTVFAATPNFQTTDIPPNITSIFRKFANLMLGQWDIQKGLSQQFEYDLKHRILANVAFAWHSRKETEEGLDQFRDEVRAFLDRIGYGEKTDGLTNEILRSGLLTLDGARVSFRHLMFQEYFAGSAVESYRDVESVISDDWWRNVIVFAFGSRPDRGDELVLIANQLDTFEGNLQYPGAVTIGLALQACFMTPLDIRTELFGRIVKMLACCFCGFLKGVEDGSQYPLRAFIYHVLEARSAVSSDLIERMVLPVIAPDEVEYFEFLKLSGAIESGHIVKVEEAVIAFEPNDERLLLGLHLLVFFILKLRVSTPAERDAATKILQANAPRIGPLIRQVFEEFKGMIMELQQGKVVVLDIPISTPEGQYELQFDI